MFVASAAARKAKERKLGSVLIRNGIPFHVLDDEEFKEFMRESGFTPPSSTKMTRDIIPDVVNEAKTEIVRKLQKSQFVTLSSDTWTNLRNESITNLVALCGGHPVFFAAEHAVMQSKTADYYASLWKRGIEKYELGNKLAGVVTDNASVMRRAWSLLQSDFPDTLFVGCHAHMLNLFFCDVFRRISARPRVDAHLQQCSLFMCDGDVVPEVDVDDDAAVSAGGPTQKSLNGASWEDISPGEYSLPQLGFVAQKITSFFRTHVDASDALRIKQAEKKLKTLQMPGQTRWGSMLRCIARVYENRDAVVSIVRDNGRVRPKLRNSVLLRILENDASIWDAMKDALDALTPALALL